MEKRSLRMPHPQFENLSIISPDVIEEVLEDDAELLLAWCEFAEVPAAHTPLSIVKAQTKAQEFAAFYAGYFAGLEKGLKVSRR